MPKVIFKDTGENIEVEQGKSLKDLTKEKGWPIAYGCEDGVCGTCIVNIEKGGENLSRMTETEVQTLEMMGLKDGKHRLCCQCKINGDVIIKGL